MNDDLAGNVARKLMPSRPILAWLNVVATLVNLSVLGYCLWRANVPHWPGYVTIYNQGKAGDAYRLDRERPPTYYYDENNRDEVKLSFETDGYGNVSIRTPLFYRKANRATWKYVPRAEFEAAWKAATKEPNKEWFAVEP
jgi:hypothetical protein